MEVGFTVICEPPCVQVELDQPTRGQPLVDFSRRGDDFAVLLGRVYYQRELKLRAGLVESEQRDAALVLSVYHALGPDGLALLEGDFALVIWDAASARLVGLRDPMGGYPLFWTRRREMWAFGTSLPRLLALLPARVLDMTYCAEFLMMPGPRNEGASEACVYEGVRRVLPATLTGLGQDPAVVERRKHWDWLRRIDDPGSDDPAEIALSYRPLLDAAVRERLQGPTLAHLSGGMDSTAIALIARELTRANRGNRPLHTFSLVYQKLSGLRGESEYIDEVLDAANDVVAHRVAADDILDYDSFREPLALDEPYAGLWRLALDRSGIDLAARLEASTVLTGVGADEIHDFQPYHLADWLRQGRLLPAWAEASRWASLYGCTPWTILQEFALGVGTPAWRAANCLKLGFLGGAVRLQDQDESTVPPWISPAFARGHSLRARAIEGARRAGACAPSLALATAINAFASRPGDVVRWSIAAPLGIALGHPFLDTRLLSFGLGILARLRPTPGPRKPILAEAVRDLLPPSIRNRRSKAHFDEVFFLGLARNQHYLEAMLQCAPEVAWEMFDQAALLQALRETAFAGTGVRKLQRLQYSLALIRWLGSQEEAPKLLARSGPVIRLDMETTAWR